jgi:polar amino acid transport system substrate-binding protein
LDEQVPKAEPVEVPARTDCLVALENGQVDAYFGHDTFLYGLKAQDHTVEIRPDILDDKLTVSHYGIAIAREHEDFVRYVNGVLESLIADGTWQRLIEKRLTPLGIPEIPPPTPDYRRDHA